MLDGIVAGMTTKVVSSKGVGVVVSTKVVGTKIYRWAIVFEMCRIDKTRNIRY